MKLECADNSLLQDKHRLLSEMEKVLLELERGNDDRELIKAIFHAAHTVLVAQLYLASIKLN